MRLPLYQNQVKSITPLRENPYMKRLWTASLCALFRHVRAAAEPATCRTVRFADVGWTDIAATTGLASTVLEGLGYKPTKDDRLRADHLRRREEQADRRVPRLLVADAWTR